VTTAAAIIEAALQNIGVVGGVDTVEAEDAALGLKWLNRVIDELRIQPTMAASASYQVVSLSSKTRTIGPGGQIDIVKPARIERGAYSLIGGISRPVEVIDREEYAQIQQKDLTAAWPRAVYFEDSEPIGTLYFWPVPQSAVSVYLPISNAQGTFATLTTDIDLADGVESLLIDQLAIRLCAPMRQPVTNELRSAARASRMHFMRANLTVPSLEKQTGDVYPDGSQVAAIGV
jgi:hypothetical protein